MYRKTECVAMLLAGGEGSRLGVLTKSRAKPAVPFGGKYRIIDFTLSNCINSGIDTVGVLTQYQPHELNEYIGNGQPWDLDRLEGGVHVLPPYKRRRGADWYKGTANAIYQNISFIDRYRPEYVLVLSGDHIYKMDYSCMLEYHREKQADCTLSIIEVSFDQVSRFGIVSTDGDGRVGGFWEKPQRSDSNKASMGVYIFGWKKLKAYLELDERDKSSDNDFGMNVIPQMLAGGEKLYTYPFKGYWKDVGTIQSLWEANMDLLSPESELNLNDPDWKIYARSPVLSPHYIGKGVKVLDSLIAEGCSVYGDVYSSVISSGVHIAPGAVIRDSVVMPGTRILEKARVLKSVIAEDVEIGAEAMVGYRRDDGGLRHSGITVIGPGVRVDAGKIVMQDEMLDTDLQEAKQHEG